MGGIAAWSAMADCPVAAGGEEFAAAPGGFAPPLQALPSETLRINRILRVHCMAVLRHHLTRPRNLAVSAMAATSIKEA
jgi:hypothetical protein